MNQPEPTGKAATQERILAAATALFLEQGYDRTTVQQVAKQAGVSRATVFWHFSEKAALFRESFSRLLQPFRDSLERDLSELEPAKRLEEQLAASERFAREHYAEVGAFVRWAVDSAVFRDHVTSAILDLNQRFTAAITQTVADLAPRGRDPRSLALGLVLAFDANLLISLIDASPRGMEVRAAAVSDFMRLIQDLGKGADRS